VRLRPALTRFSDDMERKLRAHDDDRGDHGWCDESPRWLLERLKDEVLELEYELNRPELLVPLATEEAVDVANFAMMIHDVLKREETKP